ncbi:MAG: glycosyltransferase [Myxococcota bacterium]|jgi:hypothetical protein
MKALLVAYSYPPLQDAHAIRWYYLANALADLGMEIDILTVSAPFHGEASWPLRPGVTVHRAFPGPVEHMAMRAKKGLNTDAEGNAGLRRKASFRLLKSGYWAIRSLLNSTLPGDIRTEWLPFAVPGAMKLAKTGRPDVLLTAHEPWVGCHAGLLLQKLLGVRWIADLGDPYVAPYTPRHKLAFERRIERAVYSRADALVFTTGSVVACLKESYPFLASRTVRVIEQGFSMEEARRNTVTQPSPTRVFTAAYTGTLYRGLRDPGPLAAALSQFSRPLKFVLAGRNEGFLEDFKPLGESLKFTGFVDHHRALEIQRSCDVLVHLSNSNSFQIPGKVYEYLGARKPILCITGDGNDAAARLVRDTGCGLVCGNGAGQILEALENIAGMRERGSTPPPPPLEKIMPYSWEEKARSFFDLAAEISR